MTVPTAITDLSTTAGSNSPPGSESIGSNLDDYIRAGFSFIKQNYESIQTVTTTANSASTTANAALPKAGGAMTGAINESYATVASAATNADIWGAAGNTINWTGTATTTTFPNAPQAGAKRRLICAGACSFTHSATLDIQGNADYTATAGDIVEVVAITTSTFKLTISRDDGLPITGGKIIQVVNQDITTTFSTTSSTLVSTGFGATITPKFSTSKILVLVFAKGASSTTSNWIQIELRRGTVTALLNTGAVDITADTQLMSLSYVDSPATTSSTTYNLYLRRDTTNTASLSNPGSIVLMEISA